MSDTSRPSTPRRIITLASIGGIAVIIALGIGLTYLWYQSLVRPIAVGELITKAGEFRSPDGTTVVSLVPSDDGLTIDVRAAKQTSAGSAAIGWTFDAAQPWIVTFDRAGKLWDYAPDRGTHNWQVTPTANSTMRPGSGGGWEDVPESFLLSLPEAERQEYELWREKQSDPSLGQDPS